MTNKPNEVRAAILRRLRTEQEKELQLVNNLLGEMTRYLLQKRSLTEEETRVALCQVNLRFVLEASCVLSTTKNLRFVKHKGKEIVKPITPPSETASEEDSDPKQAQRDKDIQHNLALIANDPEQAQRDKDMQKNLALIAKYFKKIYKPTNNNLRTSSNSKNKNVDTTPWENVGSPVVQQFGVQCFNCKEFGHFAKECRKPKRVKDSAYHKEKMLLCKQAEKGVPLQAEQYDWLADTNEEIDEQELEAHYSYMAKI
nr:hypothetical protein [Tanacetum cinerariifolium]